MEVIVLYSKKEDTVMMSSIIVGMNLAWARRTASQDWLRHPALPPKKKKTP